MMVRLSLGLALACSVFLATPLLALEPLLTAEEQAEGWIQLFDGETLFGWTPTSDANWRVESGTIRVDAGQPGWLMSTCHWGEYELAVEFQAPPATNSGVFIHSVLAPTNPTVDCVEVNIAPATNPFPTGSLVGRAKAKPLAAGPDDRWRTLAIRSADGDCEVRVDGVLVARLDALQPSRGHIGLQFNEGAVAFRNVKLRPVGGKLVSTDPKAGDWRLDYTGAAQWSESPPGELHGVGGLGQIESTTTHGDFVLQLEARTNSPGANSGVFFRAIPGEMLNGYECQVNSALADGDPRKPQDAGTGAIFRRQPARIVLSRDHQWAPITIVAEGPHLATWVHGVQVVDWTDDRPPHPNPRNGRRDEAGSIALQAHDPTTDVSFRRMRVSDTPPGETK